MFRKIVYSLVAAGLILSSSAVFGIDAGGSRTLNDNKNKATLQGTQDTNQKQQESAHDETNTSKLQLQDTNQKRQQALQEMTNRSKQQDEENKRTLQHMK